MSVQQGDMLVESSVRLRSARTAADLLEPHLAGRASEALLVAYLDSDLKLLSLMEIGEGSAADIRLCARTIVTEALRLASRGVLLAHNHPSGDPTPSEADRRQTRRLAEVAAELGILLHDHLIFAGGECRSFRGLGLL